MIEQATFTYSSLVKAMEKDRRSRKKQIDSLRVLKPDVQQLAVKDVVQKVQLNENA